MEDIANNWVYITIILLGTFVYSYLCLNERIFLPLTGIECGTFSLIGCYNQFYHSWYYWEPVSSGYVPGHLIKSQGKSCPCKISSEPNCFSSNCYVVGGTLGTSNEKSKTLNSRLCKAHQLHPKLNPKNTPHIPCVFKYCSALQAGMNGYNFLANLYG